VRITLALLLLGCASKHAKDPKEAERERADAELQKLEEQKPKPPLETREKIAFAPSDRCGQGPYRIESESLRAKYGEQIIVTACGDHAIVGNYRMTRTRKDHRDDSDESAFGYSRDNDACKVKATAVAQSGGGGGGGAASGTTGGGGGSGAKSALVKPKTIERVSTIPEKCKNETSLVNMTWQADSDWVPFDGHVAIDIWSDEPMDLEGLVFIIEKRAVVKDMTVARWKEWNAARDAWDAKYRAFVEGEVKAGRRHYVDTSVKTPPPPPAKAEKQPPKPSKNARWIAGYWQYERGSFHWLAGMWNVPEEDVKQDLTVHAPKPPPPPPVEQPQEPQPTTTAVWTPGQWQWDGSAYVWIPGAWRIPPSEKHTWQPSGWSVSARGAIFVPGGWRVELRR